MDFCTEFLEGWWSWEPLRRSCVRCGWCRAMHRYLSNWLWYVTRMNNSRMPKMALNYKPNWRRRLGRPLKRLLDEAETGLSRSNSWWICLWDPQALCTVAWFSADPSYTDVPTITFPPPLQKCTLLTINVRPLKWLLLASPECVYGDLYEGGSTLVTLQVWIHLKSNNVVICALTL